MRSRSVLRGTAIRPRAMVPPVFLGLGSPLARGRAHRSDRARQAVGRRRRNVPEDPQPADLSFAAPGFAVDDGTLIATAAHVVPDALQTENRETMMVLVRVPGVSEPQSREAKVVAIDKVHDVALLRISGAPLPAVTLGNSSAVRDGLSIAFTGFPIGNSLGFNPVTHRGIIAVAAADRPAELDREANRRESHPRRESGPVRHVPARRDGLSVGTAAVRSTTRTPARSSASSTWASSRGPRTLPSASRPASALRCRFSTFVNCSARRAELPAALPAEK